jgi:hypothetical protein
MCLHWNLRVTLIAVGAGFLWIYAMEMAEILEFIESGHRNLLPVGLEEVGGAMAARCGSWA